MSGLLCQFANQSKALLYATSQFFKSYRVGKKIDLQPHFPSVTYSHVSHHWCWMFESPPLHGRPGRFGQKNTSSSPHHHQAPPSVQLKNIGQNVNWDTLFSAVFFLREKWCDLFHKYFFSWVNPFLSAWPDSSSFLASLFPAEEE